MRRRGLTLVEVIVSAVVLGLVFLSVFNLFSSSILAIKRMQLETTAVSIGQSQLEACRAANYSSLADGTTASPAVTENETTFSPVVSISSLGSGLKQASVSVAWTDPGGLRAPRSIRLDLVLCQSGR